MISSVTLAAVATNAAQALGLLSIAGVMTGMVRWRTAARRDLLFAVIVFMAGTCIAQLPVHFGGVANWSAEMLFLSALGRIIQVCGAVLFIRASLRPEWPAWGWKFVVVAVAFMTWLV